VLGTRAFVGVIERLTSSMGPVVTVTTMGEGRHWLADLTVHSRAREGGIIL
jgi:hypothetical protein